MTAWVQNSDIEVAYIQESGRVGFSRFDPGTDTWTIVDETVAIPGDTGYLAIAANLLAVTGGSRATGNVPIVVFLHRDGVDHGVTNFRRTGTNAWSHNAILSIDVTSVRMAHDDDGSEDLAVIVNVEDSTRIDQYRQQSNNFWGFISNIDDTPDVTAIGAVGVPVWDETQLVAAWVDSTDDIATATGTVDAAVTPIVTGISDDAVYRHRPYLVKAGWAPNVLDMFSIEV